MTEQDKQLWKSIRTAMAEATQELVHYAPVMEDDVLLVFGLTQAEFDLLYGEVNAKCHECPERICSVCSDPTEYCCADCRIDLKLNYYVCGKSTCMDIHEKNHCMRATIGQEPDAQVLRHSDAVEGWQEEEIRLRKARSSQE